MWGDYNAVSADTFADVVLETQTEYGGVNVERHRESIRGGGNVTTVMTDWQQSVRLCANGGISACTGWK
jgi:hypothetical protein